MNQTKLVLGILLGTVVVLGGVGLLMTKLEQQPEKRAEEGLVVGEARLATGSATAKVTIVELSDFQCPACKGAESVVKGLLEKYPDQVRLVYRHFPLEQIHKNAMAAAEVAEAAETQGKFWQMHQVLFERQEEWAENRDKLDEYKQELGVVAGDYKSRSETDVEDGIKLGVNATPTFFVNGIKANTSQLVSLIEEELQK